MDLILIGSVVLVTGICWFVLQLAGRRMEENREVLDWALAQARRHDPVACDEARARVVEQREVEKKARAERDAQFLWGGLGGTYMRPSLDFEELNRPGILINDHDNQHFFRD